MSQPTTKHRQACNRCHSHKLRCNRQPGSDACSRCDSAGAPCVYSISRRGFRPPRKSPAQDQQENQGQSRIDQGPENSDINSALFLCSPDEWGASPFSPPLGFAFDFDLANSGNCNQSITQSVDRNYRRQLSTTLLPLCSSFSTPSSAPNYHLAHQNLDRQLAKLSQSLVDHLPDIPCPPASPPSEGYQAVDITIPFDRTFTITQEMTNAYQNFNTLVPSGLLSESTVFSLLGCHHHLLDIWERIFSHMRFCAYNTSSVNAVCIPAIHIGSFTSSSSLAANLYTSILTQLMSNMNHGIQSIVCALSGKPRPVTPSSSVDVSECSPTLQRLSTESPTLLACQAGRDRLATLLSAVDEIKSLILSHVSEGSA
jgi:hypothetical protein